MEAPMKYGITVFFILLLLKAASFGYKTENVHILIIDGSRYSETFGDTLHQNIPFIWNSLRPQGTIYTRFYNDSLTYTTAGHNSIISGTWQNIPNDGYQRADMPTLFEYFRKYRGTSQTDNFVILGKDKLSNLSYSSHPQFGSSYGASVAYSSSQYNDTITWKNLQATIKAFHPKLTITNFSGVDYWGHMGDWEQYTGSIKFADSVIYKFWTDIQSDPVYKDKTTLIVTNDHGRHLTNWMDHGCSCDGCRHIMLFMIGPDIQPALIDSSRRSQVDIAPTVAELLDFAVPFCTGKSLLPSPTQNVPILLTPSNGDTIQTDSVRFSWKYPLQTSGNYHLVIAKDSLMKTIIYSDSSITTQELLYTLPVSNRSYWWKVRANNPKTGWSEWSLVNRFYASFIAFAQPAPAFSINFSEEGKTGNAMVIKYTLPEENTVIIRIHSIDGSLVRSYPAGHQKAAYHEMAIDKSNLSKAVYILDFSSGNYKATYRFVID